MKPISFILSLSALAGFLPGAIAAPEGINNDLYISDISRRALPNAPNGYAPSKVDCPASRPSVRSAAKLSPNETEWLHKRREKTTSALKDFFGHVKIPNFDAAGYIDKVKDNITDVPNIGIAASGGGYRALMNGAGALKAFDSRTTNSTSKGQLGGLLQSATYLAGLSGGGWLVTSMYMNNFSAISNLETENEKSVWQFGNNILEGPDAGSFQIVDTGKYWDHIHDAVNAKKDAGFATSITDYWGRALSYQLINATEGGIDYTWSSIAETQNFQNGDAPMPVLVADGRYPDELVIGGNATVYEFNPWEFGTFDPTVYGFVPLKFLGSKFSDGYLPSAESCIRGFDNAGYVLGSSSSLFNQAYLKVNSTSLPSFIKDALNGILQDIGDKNDDIAVYKPNPFFGYRNETSPVATQHDLDIVDGGEDLQNIPLHPLIQPERHVDVIFAVDSSADTDNSWPNGTALVATYERSVKHKHLSNGTAFPAVPDQNTFVNKGLNTRPTFFGCDSKNMTGPSPLVVYLPNYPYVTFSNVSTYELTYNNTQRNAIIENGADIVTMANSTRDSEWSTCVGCAILSRSFERTNTTVPDACKSCFQKFCWDGSTNSTTPAPYEPDTALQAISLYDSAAGAVVMPSLMATVAAVSAAFWVML
ncbi:Lysophospholipase [Aspergillus sclerotialis]|uniref:Lysophospholipase n=1 Tax=Aspergillus sclerotialis TaxID=2070753 RepID=A0A3A2Z5S8_9EURO|nr:Lysophospholipase [Aspergillus sclerotialis]